MLCTNKFIQRAIYVFKAPAATGAFSCTYLTGLVFINPSNTKVSTSIN